MASEEVLRRDDRREAAASRRGTERRSEVAVWKNIDNQTHATNRPRDGSDELSVKDDRLSKLGAQISKGLRGGCQYSLMEWLNYHRAGDASVRGGVEDEKVKETERQSHAK